MEDQELEPLEIELQVLFVEDENPINSKSLENLTQNLNLTPGSYVVINNKDEFFVECAKSFHKSTRPVIALGMSAHEALINAKIAHFHMLHPSGLNNKVSDKNQLILASARCKQYISAHSKFREIE